MLRSCLLKPILIMEFKLMMLLFNKPNNQDRIVETTKGNSESTINKSYIHISFRNIHILPLI